MSEMTDKVYEIQDELERRAKIELQEATTYHKGYIKACEDFSRALRIAVIEVQEGGEQNETD